MTYPRFVLSLGLALGLALLAMPGTAEASIPPDWCTHATEQLLEGDVNGDGAADLVCHDRVTGQKKVALLESTGFEQRWSNSSLRWCSHAGATLYLGDVNGDRRADLVCKDAGRIWVDYADGAFYTGTNYYLDTIWCTHTGSVFFLGDQNGDQRADAVCRDSAGYTWLDYADGAGHFGATDVMRPSPDFEVTRILQTSGHQVTIRNNGAAGVVSRVECRRGLATAIRTIPVTIAPGASATVLIFSLATGRGQVRCTASGVGSDGLPELFISNNALTRTF